MKKVILKVIILTVVAAVLIGIGNAVLTTFEPTVSQTVGVEQALDTDAAHQNIRAYERVQKWFYGTPVALAIIFGLLLFRKEISGLLETKKEETTETEPKGKEA